MSFNLTFVIVAFINKNYTFDIMTRLNKKSINIRVKVKINLVFYFVFIERFIDDDFKERIFSF